MSSTRLLSRIRDGLVVLVLVGMVAGAAHFVITNPLGPSRILYQIEAPIIAWNTHCSDDAPHWMNDLQRYATRQQGAPASQLAYIETDGSLYHCETGWKDGVWGDQPLQADTRFRFASVTKTVTAATVVDLVNQGKLSLNDRLVDVIGLEVELKDPRVADITIEHLLSHRGGWDREATQDAMFLRGVKPWCPEQYQELAGTTLQYPPGKHYSYSNLGYCLLGVVIEKVSGQSYREHVGERFGFNQSTLRFVDGPYRPDEVVYDTRHENFYDETYYKYFDFQAIASSAGLSGSASDLARLVRRQIQSEDLSITDASDSNAICNPAEYRSCYGYGLYRYQPGPEAGHVHLHGGKFPGNTSVVMVDDQGAVLVWVGAGSKPGAGRTEVFYDQLYQSMVGHGSR
ncbi:serine hydrolase domain-containing protein [Marinobacter sp. M1N3S26]|uniref:serine hydrolase domain-containing protein n=1 Tax=unclassified Marinobacter TaxID=83889 RepID=UPI00387B1436